MKFSVIAERNLAVADKPGTWVTVRLRVPELNESGNYTCAYEITGADFEISRFAEGIDAFQALQGALIHIGAQLTRLQNEHGITLQFAGGNPGFPGT